MTQDRAEPQSHDNNNNTKSWKGRRGGREKGEGEELDCT